MERRDLAYSFIRRMKGEAERVEAQVVKTQKVDTTHSMIDNAVANHHISKMVRKSKEANRHLKKGNFGKAEKDVRRSERHKRLAMDRARYNREKLIDIHHKSTDGESIRQDSKVRSIEKLN